jgi:hypothetical protein
VFDSGGYLLAIDEYGTNEIQLEFNNSRLHTKVIGNIDDSAWHSWIVEYKSNTIKVWRDTVLQFTKVDSSRTLSTLVGWGARTGGKNNYHRVRNMKAWVSANNGTGYINNGTPHTDRLLWGRTSTQLKLQATDPSVQYDTTNSPATVTHKVHTIRYNKSSKTSSIWTNGTKLTPTETTQNTSDDRTTTRNVIGANADLSTSNMKLRELIVFNDILTDNQVSDINTSLGEKWGISTTYPVLDQWYLVFRQTLGYLWTSSQSLSLNSSDPDNDNYSILDTITDFQSTNGKYRLKYVNPANGNYNDWRQTNNLTNAVQAGYSAVNVSHSTNGFNGLGPSGDTNHTRFDGTSGGNWWYAVAAKQNHGGAFPGLDAVHNVVEVYAMNEFIGPPFAGTQTSAYSSLVSWYRMEEDSEPTVFIDSKGSNDMTVYNTNYYSLPEDGVDQGLRCFLPTRSSNAKAYNSSNASYGYAKTATLTNIDLNKFTISFWFKTSTTSFHSSLFSFNPGNPNASQTWIKCDYICDGGGRFIFLQRYRPTDSDPSLTDESASIAGETNYHDNDWHHVVCTKSGQTSSDNIKLYVDTVLKQTKTLTSTGGNSMAEINNLTLGVSNWYAGSYKWIWWAKDTKTDDFRIYNEELTTTQIAELYATK